MHAWLLMLGLCARAGARAREWDAETRLRSGSGTVREIRASDLV
jgi:hypothetical protein